MTESTTLIRVPATVRDRVRAVAQERHETFGGVIALGLDLIEKERFWEEVSDLTPDDGYRREFAAWDGSELG